ncbi:MAG: peptidylprolyl isomerase, partial [Muribaculaceae bacterium]|nr:peptidylprolyl isomerase [Muribaculaceae bacterium]
MCVSAQNNIAEEVAWMIGDTPLYKSEIEQTYQEYQSERLPINGDPYCVIPEEIAVQRLFLHQADIDTVEVQPSEVSSRVEAQINYLISSFGSKEKVEQYFRKSVNELRDYFSTKISDDYRVQSVQQNLTKDVKATPADVNKYFRSLPKDSIPYVPQQVEVKIITLNPVIPQQEIDNVKARLREYAERVNNGEVPFSTLAILYSDDQVSGQQGGELGFMGRGQLVPEFAAVAFNLNDPKKVSKIVETEYGYHIIQLIEKRGDRVNCRHILLQPEVAEKDLVDATTRLDSIRAIILRGENGATFGEADRQISQDNDTRNSNGLMVNPKTGATRFQMSELPQEIAKAVSTLQPGEIS